MKKNKGITLIALVVTIIVLLILAGISINMLTGQNGILNRAAEAKEKTGIAQQDEEEKKDPCGCAVLRVSAGHGRLRHQRDENHPGRLHEH